MDDLKAFVPNPVQKDDSSNCGVAISLFATFRTLCFTGLPYLLRTGHVTVLYFGCIIRKAQEFRYLSQYEAPPSTHRVPGRRVLLDNLDALAIWVNVPAKHGQGTPGAGVEPEDSP